MKEQGGGYYSITSPSSLLALLIFCSARSIDYVGDPNPASSFSSVRLVSSQWMTVISSCSWSNHRFRKKFQLLLAIVSPLCGSMHVVRPSVVLILVLPRRSSQSNDSARILTNPPSGFVVLCFIKPILGNRYGTWVLSRASQGGYTHDPRLPTSLLTLCPLR